MKAIIGVVSVGDRGTEVRLDIQMPGTLVVHDMSIEEAKSLADGLRAAIYEATRKKYGKEKRGPRGPNLNSKNWKKGAIE